MVLAQWNFNLFGARSGEGVATFSKVTQEEMDALVFASSNEIGIPLPQCGNVLITGMSAEQERIEITSLGDTSPRFLTSKFWTVDITWRMDLRP